MKNYLKLVYSMVFLFSALLYGAGETNADNSQKVMIDLNSGAPRVKIQKRYYHLYEQSDFIGRYISENNESKIMFNKYRTTKMWANIFGISGGTLALSGALVMGLANKEYKDYYSVLAISGGVSIAGLAIWFYGLHLGKKGNGYYMKGIEIFNKVLSMDINNSRIIIACNKLF